MAIFIFRTKLLAKERKWLFITNMIIFLPTLPLALSVAAAFIFSKASSRFIDYSLGISAFIALIGAFVGCLGKMVVYIFALNRKIQERQRGSSKD